MSLAIKICGMREPDNIMAAASLKPDLMGFIFWPGSPRYAGKSLKPDDLSLLQREIKRTGVFVDASPDEIFQTVNEYDLDIVQLHGQESPDYCRRIMEAGIGVIKVFSIAGESGFDECAGYLNCTSWFLFDTKTELQGGSGKKFNWEVLDSYPYSKPFFLSGGLGPDDAAGLAAIRSPLLYGIDLNSRFETGPGIKDIEKLEKFITEIRHTNRNL
jgi:phosphoribosylanthranilate isomerase